jgi:CheY-like chemotaxis protein
MPVMDGLEAAEKILELDPSIPIVAMTANIMNSDRDTYKHSGVYDCVGKPFTSQELWRCLMKYLKPVSWQPVNGNGNGNGNGNAEKELRYRLIKNFVKDNQNRLNEIETAAASGDIKLAYRLAHNLKSNAGQLKLTRLQQAAEKVESLLKDGVNHTEPKHMEALESELNAALAELAPLVREPERTSTDGEMLEREAARELLEKLKQLLKDSNTESLAYIESLGKIEGSGQIIRHMEDLEFALALKSLDELYCVTFCP